ncbi:MAG: hypothetical protein R2879_22090 [Saprospiraceae bacterium]
MDSTLSRRLFDSPMKIFILNILIVLFSGSVVWSQSSLTIRILDAREGIPIEGASVYEIEAQTGDITNKEGETILFPAQFPIEIAISHIAYSDTIIVLKNNPEFLEISLKPQITTLQEIIVSSKSKRENLTEERNTSVLDFTIYNDKILLLEDYGTFDKKELSIWNLKGDQEHSIFLEKVKRPRSIFRSCQNNWYVLGEDGAVSIEWGLESLTEQEFSPIDTFQKFIFPCKLSFGDELILMYSTQNEQIQTIFSVFKPTNEIKRLRMMMDPAQVESYFADLSKITRGQETSNILANNRFENEIIRNLQSQSDFLFKVVYKPEFPSFLFKKANHLLVFDPFEKELASYLEGQLQTSLPLDIYENKNWLERLTQDHKSEKIYALFKHKNGLSLEEISPETGKSSLYAIIDADRLSLGKLEVYNNTMYYLKDNPASTIKAKNLFRQRF